MCLSCEGFHIIVSYSEKSEILWVNPQKLETTYVHCAQLPNASLLWRKSQWKVINAASLNTVSPNSCYFVGSSLSYGTRYSGHSNEVECSLQHYTTATRNKATPCVMKHSTYIAQWPLNFTNAFSRGQSQHANGLLYFCFFSTCSQFPPSYLMSLLQKEKDFNLHSYECLRQPQI